MKLYLSVRSVLIAFLVVSSPLFASDVAFYGVVKSIQFEQVGDASPTEVPTNAYAFNAFAIASTNHVLTNATVSAPLHVLVPDDTNNISLRWMEQFDTQSALDLAYPSSRSFSPVNYTITMYTVNDGVKSGALSFYLLPPLFAISQPVTPHLTNFSAAQAIDTTRDFQLGWSSLGGSTLAIVQLSVLDLASNLVYMSPAPFQPGALNGTSLGAVIPAYALPPGTNLMGHLTIANPGFPNTNSYVGATGVPALARDTQFSIVTRAAPVPPRLSVLSAPGAGDFVLHLEGEPNRLYQIQAGNDFTSWTNLFSTNSANGIFNFIDANPPLRGRFYRGKVGQ